MDGVREHREAIQRILESVDMPEYLKDSILTHHDFAVAFQQLQYCKLRNRISGLVAKIAQEATIIHEVAA